MAKFQIKDLLPHALFKGADTGTSGWTSFFGGGNSGLAANISDKALMDADKNWVYIAVDKIAENLSMIPYKLLKVKKDGDYEEILDHPLLDILDNPNELMSGSDLMYVIAAHLELVGNAYLLRDLEKNPQQINPLLPDHTRIVMQDGLMGIKGYDYRVGAFHQVYAPEFVTHIKYPNPRNPLKGRGTLASLAEWVDVDSYATEFNRKFFVNGVAVGGTLETEATTKDALELAKLGFEMKYQGASNAHKTSVLPKGVKYVASKSTQRDMEFNQSLITTRNNILAGFGVPKSVIGISETGDSKSDAEAAHYAFMFFTIAPKVRRLERYLNEKLVPLFDQSDVYLQFEDPVPDNTELLLKRREVELAKGAYKTVNEVREEEGLEALEGGDDLKSGGTSFTLSQDAKNKKPRVKFPSRRLYTKKVQEEKAEKTKDSIVDAALAAVVRKEEETREQKEEAMHKDFNERTEQKVDKLSQNFKDHDRVLKEKVLQALEEVDDPQSLKGIIKKGIGDDLIDREAAIKATIEFSTPILQDIIKTEGTIRYNEIDAATGNFDPKASRIQKILEKNLKLMAKTYNDTTIKLLETKLTEAIEDGSSMVEIRDVVADVFEFTETYRAKTIAHTEVFKTANAAGREAFKQSGVVETVRWHTAEDELVCPYCGPMNGKTVGVDDAFFKKGDTVTGSDGKRIEVDYDDIVDPPLHANCRCFTLPEVIDIGEASAEDVATEKQDATDLVDDETFLDEALKIMQNDEQGTEKS